MFPAVMSSAAPYTISPTDQRGLIVIETLFMSWMIIVSLIRLYMRLAINGPVQVDDWVVFGGGVSVSVFPLAVALGILTGNFFFAFNIDWASSY